ncbi:serine/threonine transporter SstT [Bengtsoniella intestinalis]|uniref:serine/threonine transporter SstT n=1 Tax=Bengtsoniella intestinalis TaxID=3073143 RepID=UPI00391F82BF
MKQLWTQWTGISLVKRIASGLVLGAILGLVIPGFDFVSLMGSVFVGALKAIAPVLVFFLVMGALANQKNGTRSGMGHVIGLYLLGTFLSALVAVAGSFLFPVSMTLPLADVSSVAPGGVGEVLTTLVMNVVANPVLALTQGNYVGILAWAVVFGLALKQANATTKQVLTDISDAVSQGVRWVIEFAPFGILGLVYDTVSTSGIGVFQEYGMLLVLLVSCMVVVAFVINPILVYANIRQNPYPLVWKCLKGSFVTAFFTRSSAANIPVNMQLCASMGLEEERYAVSIPLGATINMAGAAVTITVMTLATVHTLGYSVDLPTAIVLSLVASVSACGTSGVAGGSLLLIPMACALFGIDGDIAMQVVGVGFMIGVVQDSVETGLNSSTDALFTAAAELGQRRKNGEEVTF